MHSWRVWVLAHAELVLRSFIASFLGPRVVIFIDILSTISYFVCKRQVKMLLSRKVHPTDEPEGVPDAEKPQKPEKPTQGNSSLRISDALFARLERASNSCPRKKRQCFDFGGRQELLELLVRPL